MAGHGTSPSGRDPDPVPFTRHGLALALAALPFLLVAIGSDDDPWRVVAVAVAAVNLLFTFAISDIGTEHSDESARAEPDGAERRMDRTWSRSLRWMRRRAAYLPLTMALAFASTGIALADARPNSACVRRCAGESDERQGLGTGLAASLLASTPGMLSAMASTVEEGAETTGALRDAALDVFKSFFGGASEEVGRRFAGGVVDLVTGASGDDSNQGDGSAELPSDWEARLRDTVQSAVESAGSPPVDVSLHVSDVISLHYVNLGSTPPDTPNGTSDEPNARARTSPLERLRTCLIESPSRLGCKRIHLFLDDLRGEFCRSIASRGPGQRLWPTVEAVAERRRGARFLRWWAVLYALAQTRDADESALLPAWANRLPPRFDTACGSA